MCLRRLTAALLLTCGALLWAIGVPAMAAEQKPAKAAAAAAAQKPAKPAIEVLRTCTECHDKTEPPVLPMLRSKHGVMADKRTPFADKACVTCHGASEQHIKNLDPPDVTFRAKTATSEQKEKMNEVCISCHQGGIRMHWAGSTHQSRDLACSSCHKAHAQQDPVRDKQTQREVCFDCHKEQRAQTFRASTHPLRAGKIACSDCHNPHGSTGPKLLVKNTVNETCYTCHAEKRGPFLWEHPPVTDNCTNCHTPHGSNNTPLLKTRLPYLCQQCHVTATGHPATLYSGTGLPPSAGGTTAAQQLLLKACENCHSQIHGSNHPSGARFQR